MAFSAIAGPIAGGVASSAIKGASGGKAGAGGGSSTGSNVFRQTQNFAPFQAPAIGRVFDILDGGAGESILLGGTGRDSLLEVPEQASTALSNALGFANDLITGGSRSEQELRSFEELINSEIGREPFNEQLGDLDDLRDEIEVTFSPFISRASALADEGINTDFRDRLLEIADEDPFSNPFVDRIVGDVTTDAANVVRDQFINAGGLEQSAAPQALAREAGRVSADIRGRFGESSRNRSLSATQAGAQFDAQNAAQRLNALIGGSNIASSSFGLQTNVEALGARLRQTQEQLRANAIAARGNVATQLANLPLAGLNAVGPLAQQFIELPFVPLLNFDAAASRQRGSTTVQSGSGQSLQNPSFFDTAGRAAGLGLLGAGILDEAGVFGTDLTGGIGTDIFTVDNSPGTDVVTAFGPFGGGLFT